MTAPMNQEAAEKIFGTLATNGSVESMGDQITGNIVSSITGLDSGEVASLTDFANELMGRDISLASRVARIEGKIAIGAEFFDDFNRGDSPNALGNGWTQGGSGQALGIYDQAAQLERASLPGDGRRYAISPQGSTNDDVTVSAVIHPRGTPNNPSTILFLRANAGLTEFVYAEFYNKRCYLGRGTRSGNSWSLKPWTSNTTKSYSNSSTIQFKAIGNKYQVVIDNASILEHEDISGYPIDSGHRTVGFAVQTWTGILAIPEYSGGLASFAVRSSVELGGVQAANQSAQQAYSSARSAQATADTAVESANSVATRASAIEKTVETITGPATIDTFKVGSGVWTKRTGVQRIQIRLVGGGGGGGGGTGAKTRGMGGGAGGFVVYDLLASQVPDIVQVTVGKGGLGTRLNGAASQRGGDTVFAEYIAGGGGPGGTYNSGAVGVTGSGTDLGEARGGDGGAEGLLTTPGSPGYLCHGGSWGGSPRRPGGDGSSPTPSSAMGPGSSGGGGGYGAGLGLGDGTGKGGDGGFPGGGGGGGGAGQVSGFNAQGGDGADGCAWIISYYI